MKTIAINDLELDGMQIRAEMNEATIEDYAIDLQCKRPFPPIVVYHDGEKYWLSEGFHRVIAARRIDLMELPVDLRKGTQKDALWNAAASNKEHGLRRTNADKRKAVATALDIDPLKSDRSIAEWCGVSEHTVADVRSANCANAQLEEPDSGARLRTCPVETPTKDTIPPTDTRTGRDGKSYPVKPDYGPPPPIKPPVSTPPQPPKVVDRVGREVPAGIVSIWERAEEVQTGLSAISKLRGALRKAVEDRDPLYAEVQVNAVQSELDNAYRHLKQGLPFAVCPTCQGKLPDGCKLCLGRGLISEHRWKTAVPKETKELIKRSIAA